MKKGLIAAFVLMVLAQWVVPGKMIWEHETILKNGKPLKFQIAPVDPYDPFRGRYIFLSYKENSISVPSTEEYESGERVYVGLKVNDSGFATISRISKTRIRDEEPYVRATVGLVHQESNQNHVTVHYPFSRFYLDEYLADEAEKVFQERIAVTTQNTYALVQVFKGKAVIKDLIINDSSLAIILKKAGKMK